MYIAGCAVLSMDMYNDGSRVIDSNFDGICFWQTCLHCTVDNMA